MNRHPRYLVRALFASLIPIIGAPLHAQDATRELVVAAVNGQAEQVKALLDKGMSPDVETNGITPLLGAAAEGHVAIVQLLLAAGADPDLPPPQLEMSPLMAAAMAGHREVIAALLERKPDLERREPKVGATALLIAAMANKPEAVRLLLQAGANPVARIKDGRTAAELTEITEIRSLLASAASNAPPAAPFSARVSSLRADLVAALSARELSVGNEGPVNTTIADVTSRSEDMWTVIAEIRPTSGKASDFTLSADGVKQAGGLVWAEGGQLANTGGPGTILRFSGRLRVPSDSIQGPIAPNGRPVEYTFGQQIAGYTFEPSAGDTLVFVLIDKGITHVAGSGRVTDPSGAIVEIMADGRSR